MAMTPKILFKYQLPAVTSAQITSGPGSGKQWIITKLRISNKTAAGSLSLTQGISGTDYTILAPYTWTINTSLDIGPIIMDNGNDLDGTSATASAAFDLVAYGYELDV
jgi:hypothetical protein